MSNIFVTETEEILEMHYVRLLHLPPIGYQLDFPNRKFVHDEEATPIVQHIWKNALLGVSVRKIAQGVEERFHFRTPVRGRTGGKPLHRNTVLNILKDPFYAGYIRLGTKLCKGLRHEAYVEEDDFLRVQDLLGTRRKR